MKSNKPLDLAAKLSKQRGIASIIVVFVITILISLVSLGFARLMDRALKDVSNNQLGAAADYAAQSGLNDAIAFVRSQTEIKKVTDCGGLSDSSKSYDKFADYFNGKTNLTSDGLTKYTCVLIDPVPGDLAFQNISQYKSQVVKLEPQGASMSELTIGWEATDVGNRNSSGLTNGNFLNENAWGNRRPVLRVTLYKVDGTNVPNPTDTNQVSTYYLFPSSGGGTASFSSDNGKSIAGNCTADENSCKVVISGLQAASYYVARLTPLYKAADVTITAIDSSGGKVGFKDAQTVIDVTGRSNTAVRRIQARVDTNIATTVNADDDASPEDAIRSAGTICKRLIVPSDPGLSDYILTDPDSAANYPGCKFYDETIPPPQVTLTANPTSIYQGDSSTLTWTVTSVGPTTCTASNDWSGNKSASGGSQSTGALNTEKTYTFTLTCTNAAGLQGKDDATVEVKAKPLPPSVVTTSVDGFGPPNATGHGTVNPNGSNVTDCHLEWGPGGTGGTSFPNRSNCSSLPGAGTSPVDVLGYMGGLAGLTVYHYRVVATNAGGTSYGADKCFKMNIEDGGGGGMDLCSAPPPPPTCPNGATNPPACDNNSSGGSTCPIGSSGGNGTSSPPNPCIYGLTVGYYSGSNTIHIQLSAAHCYSGASASWPGGSGGINWADGGAWAQTDVAGSGAGGSVSVTCSGNGTASTSQSISQSSIYGGGGSGGCTPVPGCPPQCGGTDTCGGGSGGPVTCGNGANNPPACTNCTVSTDANYNAGPCSGICSNGAINYSACTSFPCFIAGTMVLTPTGTIPIEKIKVGDEIIGWNTQSQKRVTTRVVKTFIHYNSPTLSLLTKNGWVGTTSNHPFWNGSAWVEAGKLVPGFSYIYDDNGDKQLVIAAMKGADRTVYNLEVADDTHNYFANSYLVHNKIMP